MLARTVGIAAILAFVGLPGNARAALGPPEEVPADAPAASEAADSAHAAAPLAEEPSDAPADAVSPETEPPHVATRLPFPPVPEPPPVPPKPAIDGERRHAWLDGFSGGAFVDMYGSLNFGLPKPQAGGNALRAFDASNGFSLAWAGANLKWEGERAAATIDLRFGAAPNAGWAERGIPGVQLAKQAFATWKIHEKLEVDFGRFDTIYGAEVAESWQNHTYTRGMLYNLAQPFWHTGLRARSQFNDTVGLNVMVVNGWGHIVDNNGGKSYGLQLALTPGDVFGVSLGYLGGPEGDEIYRVQDEDDPTVLVEMVTRNVNRKFRHLADLVVSLNLEKFSAALNGDYVYDDAPAELGGRTQWFGGMVSCAYQFVDWFGVGARGELLGDHHGRITGAAGGEAGVRNLTVLGTGTLTLDFRPSRHVILRLEGRYDGSNQRLFPKGYAATSANQATATLGVVVTSF